MIARSPYTILTCAVTGGITDPKSTPYLPITPEQIADSALEAAEVGAVIAHIHVRDPDSGHSSMRFDLYADVVERIRSKNPKLIINLTTGPGARVNPAETVKLVPAEQRVRHVEQLRPEICSLDFNTLHNMGPTVSINHIPIIKEMAERIKSAGVKPELECFDSGDVRIAQDLQQQGIIESDPLWQFAMGIKYGWNNTVETLTYARGMIPHDATWSAFGIGREQMPMVAATWLQGGHVRVGMEDNIYASRGVLAGSNAELVIKARRIIEDLGGNLATYDQARQLLHLVG